MRMLFVAIVATLAAGAVTACQRDDDALTVAVALLPGELPAYRELLRDFETSSGHRVRLVAQQYSQIRRALAAEAAGGRGTLDLVELDVYNLAPVADHVAVLDEAALAEELAALDPDAVEAGRIHGKGLRFLPHRVSWQAMLYDHTVLGQPPASWDEVLEVARRHPGKVALKGSLSESLTCDVLPFVWSAGGDGESFDDDGALAAFGFFAELAPYLHPDSATFKEATVAEAMARGEVVLHLNWPFAMSLYESQGLAPDRLRSATMPRAPGGGRATVLGGGYVAIARGAPHPRAAMQLLRFLVSHRAQAQLQEQLGWFSPRRDVEVGDRSGLLSGFVELRGSVRPRPRRLDYPRLSRAWQTAFRAVAFEGVPAAAALAAADPGQPSSSVAREALEEQHAP
ncbi:MAG: ABC transporter substrate-binding protein [Candidatus Binatia bacterium]